MSLGPDSEITPLDEWEVRTALATHMFGICGNIAADTVPVPALRRVAQHIDEGLAAGGMAAFVAANEVKMFGLSGADECRVQIIALQVSPLSEEIDGKLAELQFTDQRPVQTSDGLRYPPPRILSLKFHRVLGDVVSATVQADLFRYQRFVESAVLEDSWLAKIIAQIPPSCVLEEGTAASNIRPLPPPPKL